MRTLLLVSVVLVAGALAGCDLFGGVEQTSIYGRVVDAESGEPLEGFRVAFVTASGIFYGTEAFTTTDADGRYELSFQYEGQNWPMVWVNHLGTMERGCVYISHTGSSGPYAETGRRTEVNVVLPRNSHYDPVGNPASYPSPVQCTEF
ncbi:MAG TPA: carboxypeptidase-like regulatory domain-containing protein [Rubricoccaceae bacterium]|jgi:hypothetical protein